MPIVIESNHERFDKNTSCQVGWQLTGCICALESCLTPALSLGFPEWSPPPSQTTDTSFNQLLFVIFSIPLRSKKKLTWDLGFVGELSNISYYCLFVKNSFLLL
jgi:hypothetical protein